MKKTFTLLLAVLFVVVCVVGLIRCSAQKTYTIKIVVPAGNQDEFIYSEEEISPRKSQLDITSIDVSEDAKFVLKSTEVMQENTFECTNFPKGKPMLIDVEKGAWYKVGIAMQNPTDEDIIVFFYVENAKVRTE